MSRPGATERIIARILTFGGLFSIALVLGGLVFYAAEGHPQAREIVRVIHNREAGRAVDVFTSLGDVRRALAQQPPDPLAITALGLVCLLVTPVLGVAAAAVGFWRSGDRDYAAISCVVLAMLVLSFALAAAG
jgi:uncharacterized membrane protein